jgi:hypothetical protein
LLGLVVDVPVRRLNPLVAQDLADMVQVRAGPPEPTGRRVPEVMEAQGRDLGPRDRPAEAVTNVPPLPGAACEGEDQNLR